MATILSRVVERGDVIDIGGTLYAVKTKKVDRNTTGELIALVSAKKLRVIAGFWTIAADTTVRFDSHTTGALTGAMTVKAGGGMAWSRNPDGWIETAAGEALDVTLGTGAQISGVLKYVEV